MLKIKALSTALFAPLDLEVAAGECVTLQGKSGSGKSLFLRAVADLDENTGEVWLKNRQRSQLPAYEWRRKVVLIPAESGWWADHVGEHFPPGARTGEVFKALDLPDKAENWLVSRLSTGERQRLAIARALCLEPAALMLDEPTAALDPKATARVEALVRDELKKGVAVILVTHDPKQAKRMADRSFFVANGSLVPVTPGDEP